MKEIYFISFQVHLIRIVEGIFCSLLSFYTCRKGKSCFSAGRLIIFSLRPDNNVDILCSDNSFMES